MFAPFLQYVAAIPGGYVEGEGGLFYDSRRRVYHLPNFFFNRTSALLPMPQHSLEEVGGGAGRGERCIVAERHHVNYPRSVRPAPWRHAVFMTQEGLPVTTNTFQFCASGTQ